MAKRVWDVPGSDLLDIERRAQAETVAELRAALAGLVTAVDALHAQDAVVAELVRAHVNVPLCLAVAEAVRVLDGAA